MQTMEAENANIQVIANIESGSKCKLSILGFHSFAKQHYDRAYKNVSKHISLPGFRRGKVPEQVVKSKFAGEIQREWRQILVQACLNEAVGLLKLRPIQQGIECSSIEGLALGKDVKIVISMELIPEIPDLTFEDLHLTPSAKDEISEKEIETVVDHLRFGLGEWEEVPDRPVQLNDYVDLNVEKLDPEPEMLSAGALYWVQEGQMNSYMINALVGHMPGETVEVVTESEPNSLQEQTMPFVPVRCLLTINAIKKRNLPEATDELAQKHGAENLSLLRERIQKQLELKAARQKKDLLYREVDEWLLRKYPVDVPRSWIEEHVSMREKAALDSLEEENVEDSKKFDFLQKIKSAAEREAIEGYRLNLLMNHFAQRHHIEVTSEEIVKEMMYEQMASHPQEFDIEDFRRRLLLLKVRDHIIDQVFKK